MHLRDLIIQKIRQEGPLSFHDFMDMCLYYPGLGYYTSGVEKQGQEGDYYTSPLLSPVFGKMIAQQLEEMWSLSGEKEFTVVEFGAGNGTLCRDILNNLKKKKKLYSQLSYCIVEKSTGLSKKESLCLAHKNVIWHDSARTLPAITGCVLSNELVDNFPVYRVIMQDELMEVFVDYNKEFVELLKPARQALTDYLAELKIHLPKGYRTEINLDATRWIREIALMLKKGYVLTIDYGYPSDELYAGYRNRGTLVCYHKHRINFDPYLNIGEQDITTHVNFSALCLWGFKYGLEYCGFRDQGHFLQALGFRESIQKAKAPANHYLNYLKEEFLEETLLMDMGHRLKVLIQQKEMPKYELMGLKRLT